MCKKCLALIIILCCITFQTVRCENSYAASNQLIRYMGRVDFDPQNNALLSWSGSSIIVKFKGTKISAVLSGMNSKVAFYIDGVKQVQLYTIKSNNDTVSIVQNLSDAEHELIIRQASLVNYAQIHFYCILTDGQLLEQPSNNRIRLEYFGDSVSEGCAAATPDGMGRDNNAYDDNTSAYTCLLADLLKAEYNNISIGGIAVCKGAGTVKLGMETRFDKQYPFNSDKLWDFTKYKPDLCVMALGVNDYYNTGGITWDEWRSRYKEIVLRLRAEYGDSTPFLFAAAPMISSRSEPVMNIKKLVAELKSMGVNASCYVYSFYSYNGHLNASEHQKAASELYNYIQTTNVLTAIKSEIIQPKENMYYNTTSHKLLINESAKIIDSLKIYSMNGTLLKCFNINNLKNEYDVSDLANGIYVVQLKYSKVIKTQKIIISN